MKSNAIARPDLAAALRDQPVTAAGPNFMGLEILPIRMVDRKDDTVGIPDLSKRLEQPSDEIRVAKAGYPRMDYRTTEHSYACKDRGIEDLVDDTQIEAVSDQFDAELDCARNLYFNARKLQEIRLAGVCFNATTFADYTGDVSKEWSDAAATIYTDVHDAVATLLAQVGGALPAGVEIRLAVTDDVFAHMELNTQLNAKRGGGAGARKKADTLQPISEEEMAGILGIDRVVRSRCKNGSAAAWDDEYALLYLYFEGRSVAVPQLGRTWIWARDCAQNSLVETYRAENRRSTVVRVRQYTDEDLFDARCGYLLGNIHA